MSENDPAVDLREKMISLTYACPKGEYVPTCPFGILRGLSHPSRKELLARLNQGELLKLFELSTDCRCPADPRQ
jgi:hypothetical protein